jgi:uncharacterized protein YlxW (UPF0749 family)
MTHQSSRPAPSRTPCWVGASPPFSWRQRLSWLISALSGTVDLEIEINEQRETWKREDEQKRINCELRRIEDEPRKIEDDHRKIEDEQRQLTDEQRKRIDEQRKIEDEQRKLSDERWKKYDERLKEFDSKYAAPPDPSPSNSTTPPPTEPV